jgi:homoserine kinase
MAAKKKKKNSCTAAAPCSTANLGPGYDVFGLALDALEDKVTITKMSSNHDYDDVSDNKITIRMQKNELAIPEAAEHNSAGLVIKKMMHDFSIRDSIEVKVVKGVPAGYGMGSSAASASAAAVAFNELYGLRVDKNKLVEYAAEGEIASAGAKHYDNVSASLLGGFVISRSADITANNRLRFVRMDPPRNLVLVVALPMIEVPQKKTEVARSVLPREVPLKSVVHNVAGAATIVAGFALKDVDMIASGIDDIIVEPARKHLIPGYDNIKQGAVTAGALAVTISGAGPSMIALLKSNKNARKVASAMAKGFDSAGIKKTRTFICQPSRGSRVINE